MIRAAFDGGKKEGGGERKCEAARIEEKEG